MQPIYKETKQFKDYTEAANHLKGVYDRTKLENCAEAKIRCEFHGKFVTKVNVYFDHDYAKKITPEQASTLKMLALLSNSKGIGIATGDKKKDVYEIKLVTSSLSENDLKEFKQALSVHGLFVGISTLKNLVGKSENDLMPASILKQMGQKESNLDAKKKEASVHETRLVVSTQTKPYQEQGDSSLPETLNFSRRVSGFVISKESDGKTKIGTSKVIPGDERTRKFLEKNKD